MANIKDVARLANLSIGTVSNYINGKPVRRDNEERIRRAVQELEYTPNSFGKYLRTKQTKTIGVITHNFRFDFMEVVFATLENQFSQYGYNVFFCDSHGDVELEKSKLDFMVGRGVDAVVMMPRSNQRSDISQMRSLRIPVILVDNTIINQPCSSVVFDDKAAAYNAVRHLIANGHRHIACLTGYQDYHTFHQRCAGYRQALAEAGLGENIAYDIPSNEVCMQESASLLQQNPAVTAFLVTSSSMLSGFLSGMRMLSLRIPEDISYITFDETSYFSLLTAPPTYVYQDKAKLGECICDMLIKLLEAPELQINREVKTHLVFGSTVRNIQPDGQDITIY